MSPTKRPNFLYLARSVLENEQNTGASRQNTIRPAVCVFIRCFAPEQRGGRAAGRSGEKPIVPLFRARFAGTNMYKQLALDRFVFWGEG